MQQRRYRPGDVLDDYCPRERRITDHAIVAMIDDHIKQTRCVVCDAEHEYKDGKVPVQRRRKPQAALFAEVLEGLQPPQPAVRLTAQSETESSSDDEFDDEGASDQPAVPMPLAVDVTAPPAVLHAVGDEVADAAQERRDEGPVRRQLIRASFPRPEGQPPQPTRAIPEFTVRQAKQRAPRHGRRRAGGGGQFQPFGGGQGASRFGRSASGNGGQARPRRRRGKKG